VTSASSYVYPIINFKFISSLLLVVSHGHGVEFCSGLMCCVFFDGVVILKIYRELTSDVSDR